MTKSQINRLGERLRTASELGAETLSQLQQFRASYDESMFRAQLLLKEAGLQATSRLKTINTIIEKLRRKGRAWPDARYWRIAHRVEGGPCAQDKIVNKILDMFPNAKVIDRRKSPKHGYRAIHVIAMLDDRRIEIFISHSSANNGAALALAQWLAESGWAEYFLDISPSRGLAAGERWQESLDRLPIGVFSFARGL